MSGSYNSKLRDARWQRKRLEIMERDNWTCRSCGAAGEGVTLNVHHAYYESGKDPWDYPDDTLVTWCEECHIQVNGITKELQRLIAINRGYDLASEIVGYIHGRMGEKKHDAKNYNRGFTCGVYSFSIGGGVE